MSRAAARRHRSLSQNVYATVFTGELGYYARTFSSPEPVTTDWVYLEKSPTFDTEAEALDWASTRGKLWR